MLEKLLFYLYFHHLKEFETRSFNPSHLILIFDLLKPSSNLHHLSCYLKILLKIKVSFYPFKFSKFILYLHSKWHFRLLFPLPLFKYEALFKASRFTQKLPFKLMVSIMTTPSFANLALVEKST